MASKQLEHDEHKVSGEKFPLQILAHNISSPYNVGGLFRLADALGVAKLWLSGDTPIPPNKKMLKTARSTEKYVAFEHTENPLKLVEEWKTDGAKIVCLEICDNSIDLEEIPELKNQNVCLILGEENKGVHADYLAMADIICHIPMQGNNSSMNLVSATSIATYTLINKMKP